VSALVHDTGSDWIRLRVSLTAGGGGGGDGAGAAGHVVVGPIAILSDGGGDVDAVLSARGGGGGIGIGGANADGGAVALRNAFAISTSGSIYLTQTAAGGDAGGIVQSPAGAGGDAASDFEQAFSATNVTAGLYASGGLGSPSSLTSGRGGDASIHGVLSNDAGELAVYTDADGGTGGGLGRGGNASVDAHGVTLGDGHTVQVSGRAVGGSGDRTPNAYAPGKRGGDASASVWSEAQDQSDSFASAEALGGWGGVSLTGGGSDGGNAEAEAFATTHGFATATAQAYATGGSGAEEVDSAGNPTGEGGTAGTAMARAHASSDFGEVHATVLQVGGGTGLGQIGSANGADSVLENAATGETLGDLYLEQAATGGGAGGGAGTFGGNARSVLDVERTEGGSLDLRASAEGGAASNGGAAGGAYSFVDAVNHSSGGVFVSSVAQAGRTGSGAGPTPEVHARGESLGGGDVVVQGVAAAGEGSVASAVTLANAVSGETSARLSLLQEAVGGQGIDSGGAATSVLTHEGSSSFMELWSEAHAGSLTWRDSPDPVAEAGDATASAVADARNHAGGVDVGAAAWGGHDAFAGGAANASADGESFGDAADVSVHSESHGGFGLNLARLGYGGTRGGDAQSSARGLALGNSQVDVWAEAQGGNGGFANAPAGVLSEGGAGGDARADADAIGAGSGRVTATALAWSGVTGASSPGAPFPLGPKGMAIANANATGLGEVFASSWASSESSSLAAGHAVQLGGRIEDLRVTRTADGTPGRSTVPAFAEAGFRGLPTREQFEARTGLDQRNAASAFADFDPATGATWLAGNPNVSAAVANHGELLALGAVTQTAYTEHASSSLEFDLAALDLASDESLFFGWLDTESRFQSFDVLHVALDANGTNLFDREFADADTASATLDDLILPIATGGSSPFALSIVVRIDARYSGPVGGDEITPTFGASSSDFALFIARSVSAPEPGAAGLLALTLAGLVARAIRSRSR
jgi:hypothetical protein